MITYKFNECWFFLQGHFDWSVNFQAEEEWRSHLGSENS